MDLFSSRLDASLEDERFRGKNSIEKLHIGLLRTSLCLSLRTASCSLQLVITDRPYSSKKFKIILASWKIKVKTSRFWLWYRLKVRNLGLQL